MKQRSVVHATFAVERTFPHAPARVFGAYTTVEAKKRWFAGPPGIKESARELDFRVGGREVLDVTSPDGKRFVFNALYQDIVPEQRIVYTYEMHIAGERISVSVATVQFQPEGAGTKVVVTEQGAYLDGLDTPEQRELGTKYQLAKLEASLKA
ncbi:MAG TPA: SRPBCC family protein [bacterium]|nr:SRPBCC family protein [bacterium]